MNTNLNTQLEELDKEIKEIHNKLKPLQEKRIKLANQIQEINLQELLPLNPEKVVNSNYFVFDSDRGYKELSSFMKKYKNISVQGFWSNTNKKALQICLKQESSFESQLAEIMEFLPVMPLMDFVGKGTIRTSIKESIDCSKVKVFAIMEHSLSAHGVFNLVVDESNKAGLIKTTYGNPNLLKVLPFEEMIKYIIENHSYDKRDDEDNDD